MNSFSLDGDMQELMHKGKEPFVELRVYNHVGKRKIVKPRCELCAFSEVVDFDYLLCSKTGLRTLDYGVCNDFNITRSMLSDIYHGCII